MGWKTGWAVAAAGLVACVAAGIMVFGLPGARTPEPSTGSPKRPGVERPADQGVDRPAVAIDADAIQGTWTLAAMDRANVEPTEEERKTMLSSEVKLVVAADRLTLRGNPGAFSLDPAREPKTITVMEGEAGKTRTVLGIYSLQGDELKICWAGPNDKTPPAGFDVKTAAPGTTPVCMTFKRDRVARAGVAPPGIGDLRAFQDRVAKAVKTVQPAVVAVRHTRMPSAASGVIITPAGLVLSQHHVSHAMRATGEPDKSYASGEKTTIVLHDGTECEAELLGASRVQDISLLRILRPGKYPYAPLSKDAVVGLGDWVLKLGHPGHLRKGVPAAVRLGRVITRADDGFCSDCLINGGDSGGPFFDLDGRLIGVVRLATADMVALLPADGIYSTRTSQFLFSASSNAVILRHFDAMRRGVVDNGQTSGNVERELMTTPQLPWGDWSQGADVLAAYRPVVTATRAGTVAVSNGSGVVALGTVVECDAEHAWVVTKASELPAKPRCRLPDGTTVDATVVGVDPSFDLATLRVPASGLKAVRWADSFDPPAGTLVAAVGPGELPVAVGVVGVPRRDVPGAVTPKHSLPLRVPAARIPISGQNSKDGYRVERVYGGTPWSAGIRPGDVIAAVAGSPVGREGDLPAECVQGRMSGDLVAVEVSRGGKRVDIELPLHAGNEHSPGWSYRSTGFPTTIELALPVLTNECGGAVVDSAGRVVAITIARSAPHCCVAIPGDRVRRLVSDFRSGKLAGNWAPQGPPAKP